MNKKGRITIPSKIRNKEGFKVGQQFLFLKSETGYELVPLLSEKQLQEDLIPASNLAKSIKDAHIEEIELEKQ